MTHDDLARIRRICAAEGLPEARVYELLGASSGVRGVGCTNGEIVLQRETSWPLILHELAHVRYPHHDRDHSYYWLHLLETYCRVEWREETFPP